MVLEHDGCLHLPSVAKECSTDAFIAGVSASDIIASAKEYNKFPYSPAHNYRCALLGVGCYMCSLYKSRPWWRHRKWSRFLSCCENMSASRRCSGSVCHQSFVDYCHTVQPIFGKVNFDGCEHLEPGCMTIEMVDDNRMDTAIPPIDVHALCYGFRTQLKQHYQKYPPKSYSAF